MDDILGYSRDMGSRNTLWIPSDFTIKELLNYLYDECISDPKLVEIRRIDTYMNPFQPQNWDQIDNLEYYENELIRKKNNSYTRQYPIPYNEYRRVEPIELLKIREKARNTMVKDERYIESDNWFKYWHIPKPMEPQGTSINIPKYNIPEESRNIKEFIPFDEQIKQKELEFNQKLNERKEWYLNQLNDEQRERLTQEFKDSNDGSILDSIQQEYMRNEDESIQINVINNEYDINDLNELNKEKGYTPVGRDDQENIISHKVARFQRDLVKAKRERSKKWQPTNRRFL